MGRQSRPLTGWVSPQGGPTAAADSAAANFGAPLPSDGGAKGSKPTIWTEARRDAPRGDDASHLNECMEETTTVLTFARLPLHVMPGLVPGIHALLCDQEGVDGRDKPGHDEL